MDSSHRCMVSLGENVTVRGNVLTWAPALAGRRFPKAFRAFHLPPVSPSLRAPLHFDFIDCFSSAISCPCPRDWKIFTVLETFSHTRPERTAQAVPQAPLKDRVGKMTLTSHPAQVSCAFVNPSSTLSSSQPGNQHQTVCDAPCAVVTGPQFRHIFEASLPCLFPQMSSPKKISQF